MYKNSVNRKLTRAVKSLTILCDRGHLEKAEVMLAEVEECLDDLMAFTKERINIKNKREQVIKEAKKEKQEDEIREPVTESGKKTVKAKKAVPTTGTGN